MVGAPVALQPEPAVPRFTHLIALLAALLPITAEAYAQVASPTPTPGFATIYGVAVDSIRQQPLSKAIIAVEGTNRITLADGAGNYRIDSIPPGSYRISIAHPVLDTLGMTVMTLPMVMRPGEVIEVDLATPSPARVISLRCPPGMLQRFGPGALMGQVYDPDSLKAAVGAKVQLVYQETLLGFKGQPIVRDAIVDSTGTYKICGLPRPVAGKLQVFRNGVSTGQVDVDIEGGLGLRSLTIAVAQVATITDTAGKTRRLLSGNSRLAGRVVNTAGRPVESARVSVDGAAPVAITNERGEFTLDSLPSGTQTVEVRKIGYAATEQPVELSIRAVARTTVTLDVAELAPVRIIAGSDRVLEDLGYADRKRRGIGTFIDGDQIAQQAVRFSDAMRTVPGIRVQPAGNGRSTIVNSRDPVRGCVVTWVDNMMWREMMPGDFDDFVLPSEVRAVEVYSSNTAPAQFQMPGSTSCATIVVWTNRYVNRKIKK
jgi:protocatechuate 3,4-dioxygenase beta subunit